MSILNPMSLPTGSAGEVYSTEETRIGTWIDGKPLYRRVYEITTPSDSELNEGIYYDNASRGNIAIPWTWENIRVSGFVTDCYNFFFPLPAYWHSGVYLSVGAVQGRSLCVYCAHGNFASRPATIILEYTKTTD